jgi:alpha,alpha-trehalase
VEGLLKYGFLDDALRIAHKFVHLILKNFKKTRLIKEKYDVVNMDNETSLIGFGYSANEIGFGWTNGVIRRFLDLLQQHPQ